MLALQLATCNPCAVATLVRGDGVHNTRGLHARPTRCAECAPCAPVRPLRARARGGRAHSPKNTYIRNPQFLWARGAFRGFARAGGIPRPPSRRVGLPPHSRTPKGYHDRGRSDCMIERAVNFVHELLLMIEVNADTEPEKPCSSFLCFLMGLRNKTKGGYDYTSEHWLDNTPTRGTS